MSTELFEEALDNLSASLSESVRLSQLSDLDLIRECFRDDLADDERVLELMRRVKPDWLDEVATEI